MTNTEHLEALRKILADIETRARETLRALPDPDMDLASLLEALAAAEDHADQNFIMWPRKVPSDHPDYPYREGTECYEDWAAVCNDRSRAVAGLLRYARALRQRKAA